jgi:hypothetical protein
MSELIGRKHVGTIRVTYWGTDADEPESSDEISLESDIDTKIAFDMETMEGVVTVTQWHDKGGEQYELRFALIPPRRIEEVTAIDPRNY